MAWQLTYNVENAKSDEPDGADAGLDVVFFLLHRHDAVAPLHAALKCYNCMISFILVPEKLLLLYKPPKPPKPPKPVHLLYHTYI
jgi:hypothetical protein